MCTLHYLCSYTQSDLGRRIITQPSGVTKIDYIKSALKKAGYTVNILSLSEGDFEHPFFIYKSLTIKIDKAETLKFISTFCRSNVLLKVLSRLWMYCQLWHYLIFKVKQDDCVLIYHSLAYVFPIKVFRFFSNRKIYFEVEELFNAAYSNGELKIEKEKKYLRNAAGYLLINDLISKLSGFSQKGVVCYGIYSKADMPKTSLGDGKIHLLYAGVIGHEDALMAVDMCRFLSHKYYMHIERNNAGKAYIFKSVHTHIRLFETNIRIDILHPPLGNGDCHIRIPLPEFYPHGKLGLLLGYAHLWVPL